MSTTPDRQTDRFKLAFAVVMAFGAVVRLLDLGGESFWIDEVFSARIVEGPFAQIIHRIPPDKPPLEYFVQALFHRIGPGNPEFWHRLPAALAGILALPAFYLIGKLWFSRRVGMIAMILAASNTLLIYYSREARPYSLFLMFSVWQAVLLSRIWLGHARGRSAAVGTTLLGIAAVYTLYTQLAVLALELVAIAIATLRLKGPERAERMELLRGFAGSVCVTLVAALPLRMVANFARPEDHFWRFQIYSWRDASELIQVIYFPGQTLPLPIALNTVFTIATLLILAAGFVAAWRRQPEGATLLGSFAILYFLLPIGYFFNDRPFGSRYAITVAVGAIPLAAVLIDGWMEGLARRRLVAIPAICIAIYSTFFPALYFAQRPDRPDWRGACASLARRAVPGDAVVMLSEMHLIPIAYYLKRYGVDYLPVLSPEKAAELPLPARVFTIGAVYGSEADRSPYWGVALELVAGGVAMAARAKPLEERDGVVELPLALAQEGLVPGGWGPPEFWGETGVRWTNKLRVSLFLPLEKAPDGPRRVALRFHPFSPEGAPPQTVRLYMNGRAFEPLAVKLGEMQEVSWAVDATDLKAGVNTVEIETAWVDSPSKYKANYADFRILGLAVESLRIIRPEGAPSSP